MQEMAKLDGENHDSCYDLRTLGTHRHARVHTDATISQQEYAPINLPVLKILLHKVACLDNVLFSFW